MDPKLCECGCGKAAEIRRSGLSNNALAEKYGIHPSHVSRVRRGLKWADVPAM